MCIEFPGNAFWMLSSKERQYVKRRWVGQKPMHFVYLVRNTRNMRRLKNRCEQRRKNYVCGVASPTPWVDGRYVTTMAQENTVIAYRAEARFLQQSIHLSDR